MTCGVPSPKLHKKEQPGSGGISVAVKVAVALLGGLVLGSAHPCTVTVKAVIVGHSQGGTFSIIVAIFTQGVPATTQFTLTVVKYELGRV